MDEALREIAIVQQLQDDRSDKADKTDEPRNSGSGSNHGPGRTNGWALHRSFSEARPHGLAPHVRRTSVVDSAAAGDLHFTQSPTMARRAEAAEVLQGQLDRKALDSVQHSQGRRRSRGVLVLSSFGVLSAIFTVGCLAAGGVLAAYHPGVRLYHLRLWRWAFFLGCLCPLVWLDWGLSRLLKRLLEVRLLRHGMLAYLLTGTRKPVARFLATVAAASAFALLFAIDMTDNADGRHAFFVVLRVLLCFVIAAAGGIFSAGCTKLAATAFQKQSQLDAMRRALEQEYLLTLLADEAMSGARPVPGERQAAVLQLSRTFKVAPAPGQRQSTSGRSHTLESLTNVRALEKHLRSTTLGQSLSDTLRRIHEGDDVGSSETEARRLAVYLFWKLNPIPDRPYLLPEDIQAAVGREELGAALDMLDSDRDGRVSLPNMREAVVALFQRRADLAATLRDTNTVVGQLRGLLTAVVQLMLIFVYLMVFRVDIAKAVVAYYSVIFVFLFVFGSAIRDAYDHAFFLFVVHPFDVGDLVVIGEEQFLVERLNLNSAVLLSGDNTRVWYPTAKLAVLPIRNISRSGPRGDSFSVLMDIGTHPDVFRHVRKAVNQHIEQHRREFAGEAQVLITKAENPMKMEVVVGFQYSHSGSDQDRMARARHDLYLTISECMAKLEAGYTMPTIGNTSAPLIVAPEAAATLVQQQPELARAPFAGLKQRRQDTAQEQT